MHKYIIRINNLKIKANLGATEKEKSRKQHIVVDVEIKPSSPIELIDDNLDKTINYSEVRNIVKNYFVRNKPNLIETASYEIADIIYKSFKCKSVSVRISKFPYRDTRSVSVEVSIGN